MMQQHQIHQKTGGQQGSTMWSNQQQQQQGNMQMHPGGFNQQRGTNQQSLQPGQQSSINVPVSDPSSIYNPDFMN